MNKPAAVLGAAFVASNATLSIGILGAGAADLQNLAELYNSMPIFECTAWLTALLAVSPAIAFFFAHGDRESYNQSLIIGAVFLPWIVIMTFLPEATFRDHEITLTLLVVVQWAGTYLISKPCWDYATNKN